MLTWCNSCGNSPNSVEHHEQGKYSPRQPLRLLADVTHSAGSKCALLALPLLYILFALQFISEREEDESPLLALLMMFLRLSKQDKLMCI